MSVRARLVAVCLICALLATVVDFVGLPSAIYPMLPTSSQGADDLVCWTLEAVAALCLVVAVWTLRRDVQRARSDNQGPR
jgi:hypothetical protein